MPYNTNFLYPHARNLFLKGDLDWDTASRFYLMFLNAGVGTADIYGTGTTHYAVDPKSQAASTWASWGVTYLSHIPFTHRTLYNVSTMPQFGGTAVTYELVGTATSIGNGVAEAGNVTYYAVPSGAAVSAFVIYRRPAPGSSAGQMGSFASTTLQDAASELIAFFGDATGMPVNGNNGDITVQWDSTQATRIFRL